MNDPGPEGRCHSWGFFAVRLSLPENRRYLGQPKQEFGGSLASMIEGDDRGQILQATSYATC